MIHLSEAERAVLSVCQLQADLPLQDLARQAGLSTRATRRNLEKLQARGVLTPYVLINHFAQGLQEIGVYLTLGSGPKDAEKRLDRFIETHAVPGGVTELGGAYALCFDLLLPCLSDLQKFLEELTTATECPVLSKAIVVRSSRTLYQRKFFRSSPRKKESVTMTSSGTAEKLDGLDRKILEVCTKFPAASRRELALRAKIPQSTFEYRIKLLAKRNVLLGFAYAFRSIVAGLSTFRILALVKRPSEKGARSLEAFCRSHPNAVTFNNCIGAWDHEIRVEFEQPAEVNRFRQTLLTQFPEYLADVQALPFLGTRKLSSFSP